MAGGVLRRSGKASSVTAAPCQLPRRGSRGRCAPFLPPSFMRGEGHEVAGGVPRRSGKALSVTLRVPALPKGEPRALRAVLAPRIYEGGGPRSGRGSPPPQREKPPQSRLRRASSPRGEAEGASWHPLLYRVINYGADFVKMPIDIQIAKSDNFQTVFFQFVCSYAVIKGLLWIIMPAAIQFDNQFGLKGVKVGYKVANTFLTLETYRVGFQKTVPEFSFPRRHVFAELSRSGKVILIVFHEIHTFSLM